MCTDRDCKIFRGMLIACDECERMNDKMATGPGMHASRGLAGPKGPKIP